jgi:hypothetical protein
MSFYVILGPFRAFKGFGVQKHIQGYNTISKYMTSPQTKKESNVK